MKKIIFLLVALVCSMSMNAQIIEVYKGETLVKSYKATEADHVIFREAVKLNSITLNKTETTIWSGKTESLTATVAPDNADNKAVEWSTSDYTVATVSAEGVVTANAAGSAIITATAADGGGATATCSVTVKSTTGTVKVPVAEFDVDVNWVQLWENGPKFADRNIGAESSPTGYGCYYCWGGFIDKDQNGTHITSNDPLSGSNDTATRIWGSAWRMPTKEEFEALLTNCDVEWTTVNGVNGCKFTAKTEPYKPNSIFLPAGGYFANFIEVFNQGRSCEYWSSTPMGPLTSYILYTHEELGRKEINNSSRSDGLSVRPVLAE